MQQLYANITFLQNVLKFILISLHTKILFLSSFQDDNIDQKHQGY